MEEIRLFIADDEPMSIEYFKSFFRNSNRYLVIGEAYDGKSAYEKIIHLKPDLIFADISMPVMNGLELAEKLLQEDSATQIILLTSYRDFDYAKRGLELGVASYLLKHQISQELLFGEIEKMMQKVSVRKETEQKLLHHNLRQFFVSSGAEDDVSFAPYRRGEEFMLLVITWNKPLMWSAEDKDKISVDWADLEDYQAGFFRCRAIIEMDNGIYTALCFLKSGYSRRELGELVYAYCGRLQGAFHPTGNTAAVIVSNPIHNFYQLPMIYQKLVSYFGSLFRFARDQVFYQEELKAVEEPVKMHDATFELLGFLEEGEEEGVTYTKKILSQAAFVGSVQEYGNVIRDIGKVLEHFTRRKQVFFDFRLEYRTLYTVQEVENWVISLEHKLFQEIADQNQGNYSTQVKDALYYMKVNYEHNISVQDIADYCNLSESHLRKKFKQEMGNNIVDYLTGQRIQRAKELLRDSTCRVVDVYEKVGFTSSQYFSSVFKKTEGISPSEYKKLL